MPGKPATDRQRLEAAKMIARGERPSVVARATGVSARTLRRWRESDADFAQLVARATASAEHTEHRNAVRSARRHGLPDPTPPGARRQIAAEMDAAAERVQAQAQQRVLESARANPSDDEVIAWWLQRAAAGVPATREEWLCIRDAEAGRVTDYARQFMVTGTGRRQPQIGRIRSIPTNASILFEEQRLPDYIHDPFAGSYAKATDDGSSRVFSGLREEWRAG